MRAVLCWTIAIGSVASCYSPGYQDCLISCPQSLCPSGLSCQMGMCRTTPNPTSACGVLPNDGAMDADPNGDLDGDGVKNKDDNCPTIANATQANEDGDEFGDACDPCPPFAGVDNNDRDHDGVGDGCDPNPDTPGDSILLFDGFKVAPLVTSGVRMLGPWTFTNGQAASSSVGAGFPPYSLVWPQIATEHVLMLTKGTINTINALNAGTGLIDLIDANTGRGTECTVGRDPNGADAYAMLDPGPPIVRLAVSTPMPYLNVNVLFGEKRGGSGVAYKCSASVAPDLAAATSAPIPMLPFSGLQVRQAAATFDWIMIVKSP